MNYSVPLQDVRFTLRELAGLDEVLSHAPDGLDADVVDAVLDEHARFVQEQVAPLNRAGDVQPPQWADGTVRATPGFKAAYDAWVAAGWQGLAHASALGGQGLPGLVAAAASESLSAANLSFSLCPLLTNGVIEALSIAGSPELQQRYLPALVTGRWTGTMNLTEPQAGSDLALISTRATRAEDGRYRLHGQKIFITWGEHDLAENIVHLVLARTPGAPAGVKGLSLFVVPKFLIDAQGRPGARNDVYCASIEHKLGIHGSPTAVMMYGSGQWGTDGSGAIGELVGAEHQGLKYMFIMMNAARFAVGLQGVALCERAWQLAQAYAAQRLQGQALQGSDGPVAIEQHPDVARMLGLMHALARGTRAVAYGAAAHADLARSAGEAAGRGAHRAIYEYLVPIVKAFSTEAAVEATSLGIQVHGGMGYIEDTGAAQLFRDARILPIYEGTTGIQANDFIGRKLLADGGAVAHDQIAAMRQTVADLRASTGAHADGLARIADALTIATSSYESAVRWVVETADHDLRGVYAGSVPCLMLAGVTHAGWQLARAALASEAALVDHGDRPFYVGQIATAVCYACQVLPRASALWAAIQSGPLQDAYDREVRH